MNKLFVFLCCIIFVSFTIAEKSLQESFIAPPRLKKESHNKILEKNAQLLMNNTKKTAHLTTLASTIQEQLLEHGNEIITQKKDSFFNKAGTEMLQEYTKLSEELSRTLDSCQRSLQQVFNKITNLTNSCSK